MKSLNKIISAIIIFLLILSCGTKKQISLGEYPRISEERKENFKNKVNVLISKTKEFHKKKIDFIVYKSYSIGSIIAYRTDSTSCSNCYPDDSLYLIWNENGKAWIQEFDNCGIFFPIELNNSEITDFATHNFEIIKTEKIKYYRTDKNTYSMVDHSTFKEFLIMKSDIETYNVFDIYDLSNDSEYPNINYQYNNNLKIVKLNKMINKVIIKLNSRNLFKRDLSQCR